LPPSLPSLPPGPLLPPLLPPLFPPLLSPGSAQLLPNQSNRTQANPQFKRARIIALVALFAKIKGTTD
jgi:hypothetical protein